MDVQLFIHCTDLWEISIQYQYKQIVTKTHLQILQNRHKLHHSFALLKKLKLIWSSLQVDRSLIDRLFDKNNIDKFYRTWSIDWSLFGRGFIAHSVSLISRSACPLQAGGVSQRSIIGHVCGHLRWQILQAWRRFTQHRTECRIILTRKNYYEYINLCDKRHR